MCPLWSHNLAKHKLVSRRRGEGTTHFFTTPHTLQHTYTLPLTVSLLRTLFHVDDCSVPVCVSLLNIESQGRLRRFVGLRIELRAPFFALCLFLKFVCLPLDTDIIVLEEAAYCDPGLISEVVSSILRSKTLLKFALTFSLRFSDCAFAFDATILPPLHFNPPRVRQPLLENVRTS